MAARAIYTLVESGEMHDVLGEINLDRLIDGSMASVEPRFLRDAIIFGLTGGAYAPVVTDKAVCEDRVGRYIDVIPGMDQFEIMAIDPCVSPWFWNDWVDFFFVMIRRHEGWIGVYAASDID